MNFDPQILTMIRETECMARLGLEIPPLARTMRAKQADYKDNYDALQVSGNIFFPKFSKETLW